MNLQMKLVSTSSSIVSVNVGSEGPKEGDSSVKRGTTYFTVRWLGTVPLLVLLSLSHHIYSNYWPLFRFEKRI